ncbi:DNA polymerase III gamma/tau subunit-like domain-containing protein [Pandoravirus kuranda]|uniref:DNA polymerase III gamma/tau subunit-like domain-containing protein n=1 Tax=Pandoravirus kuranda TaxID=3019033 RepID=A0AA95ECS7_9VIRU|nr:DNA polymerase III gamma/tau subunit-like domain-containing protein [Pandoravirus kuranda]
MNVNIAEAARRAQQAQQQGPRGPPTPVVGTRGGRAATTGATRSVSTAPIRPPREQRTALPRLAPRPPGVGQVPALTAQPPATFGPRLGAPGAAGVPPQLTPEEEAALFADIESTLGEFNIPPESYEEEYQRIEREVRLASATPGPISAQQMIDFFRNAGQDPNAPPDVQVEYPDGEMGPARYSICAEAINERWGGFTRRLFERMEQERRRGPGTAAGRLSEGLRSLALTTQYEHEHYMVGVNIAGAPPAISNAVLLPAAPPQPGAAAPFVALTPAAARGLGQAAVEASNVSVDPLTAIANQIRAQGGGAMTIEELEREMLSPEPSDDPLIREGQQRVDEVIATAAREVASPLVNAIVQQTQMESMMGQFPAGGPRTPAAVAQQPALVTPITPQQADALVTANVEAQQEEAASRRATPVPSPVPVPASPLGAGVPSPAQVTAALQRAVAQRAIAGPRERRRLQPTAQPVGRPGRPGARTAPSTPQGAAPAAPTGYPSAPTTPLSALASVIRTTGEAPDTQALGVASPPVVPATTDGVLQLVEADTRRILSERVALREGALATTTAALSGLRQQLQTESQQAPELAQVTRTSLANVINEQVPPAVAQEVTAYLEQPGEVSPDAARNVAGQLFQAQSEATAAAPPRAEAPEQRAAARARERLVKNINDAAATVDEYNQQIAQDIQDPLFDEVTRILGQADASGIPVTDELVNLFYDRAYDLAVVAVNGVSNALNQIASEEAQAPGRRGAATVTPGTQ